MERDLHQDLVVKIGSNRVDAAVHAVGIRRLGIVLCVGTVVAEGAPQLRNGQRTATRLWPNTPPSWFVLLP